jgi:hypothetical protein
VASAVTTTVKYYELEDLTPSQFEVRKGCRVTLFQDAHCEGDYPPFSIKDNGMPDTSYVPPNCFEQMYQYVPLPVYHYILTSPRAILDAKRFIYITGWSVDTKISLLRRKPIFEEEGMSPSTTRDANWT